MAQKVLVVDDNATIRSLSRKILEGMSFSVEEAVDGEEGLEYCKRHQFCLILSDINMPKMNGLDMIKSIRRLPNYARIPILIISTESNPNMMQQGKTVGANGWMVKPFKREKLIEVLKKLSGKATS